MTKAQEAKVLFLAIIIPLGPCQANQTQASFSVTVTVIRPTTPITTVTSVGTIVANGSPVNIKEDTKTLNGQTYTITTINY